MAGAIVRCFQVPRRQLGKSKVSARYRDRVSCRESRATARETASERCSARPRGRRSARHDSSARLCNEINLLYLKVSSGRAWVASSRERSPMPLRKERWGSFSTSVRLVASPSPMLLCLQGTLTMIQTGMNETNTEWCLRCYHLSFFRRKKEGPWPIRIASSRTCTVDMTGGWRVPWAVATGTRLRK